MTIRIPCFLEYVDRTCGERVVAAAAAIGVVEAGGWVGCAEVSP